MKIAPIMREMAKFPDEFEQILVHTGQHYDENMSKVFFDDLELPQPDVYLGVGSGSHAQQTARVMLAFEPVLLEYQPDWVIVVGDVNSTVACAFTAVKLGIKVAHVEAGLRSFDRTMPEEINRILTDHIADLLFTTEPSANENLWREGIPEEKIHFVGNVMIDTLVRLLPKAENRPILEELGLVESGERMAEGGIKKYVLVTLHRPSNVDDPVKLSEIIAALNEIATETPVIFPVHPRTRERMDKWQIVSRSIQFLDPLGYLDFLSLMRYAALVVTDSGGIQEETTYLGVPCLTVRENTERPVTIQEGSNRLIKSNELSEIIKYSSLHGFLKKSFQRQPPKLWDGIASRRIADIFLAVMN